MKSNYYALIMAGGVGSRFWPKSRKNLPKQFQDFMGSGKTLLQHTVDRLRLLIPSNQILILTNELYSDLVLEQIADFQSDQVILEPSMRNTAPCLLYASLKIQKLNPAAQIIVAPSDHWINESDLFIENLKEAFNHCLESQDLITFGIKPTQPHTGYGYLELANPKGVISKVLKFIEKPSFQVSQQFLSSGNFFWNSGIFVWNVKTILTAFEHYQPSMFALFEPIREILSTPKEIDFIKDHYKKAENVSIDYAILEQVNNLVVIRASFNWNDLGTWNSLYDQLDKDDDRNAVVGAKTVFKNAEGNMIHSKNDKLVVVEGLNDFVVVDNEDVLLIFPKENDQNLKDLIKKKQLKFGDQFE